MGADRTSAEPGPRPPDPGGGRHDRHEGDGPRGLDAWLAALGRAIIGRPLVAVALLAATLGPTIYLSSRLGLESSFTALLPDTHRAVRDLRAGVERTGGSTYAIVAIGASDRKAAEAYADELAARLASESFVRYARAKFDIDFLKERALLYLSSEQLEALTTEIADEIDARTIEASGLGLGLSVGAGGGSSSGMPGQSAQTSTLSLDLDKRFRQEAAALKLPVESYLVGKDGRYLSLFVALQGVAGNLGEARRTQGALEQLAREVRDHGPFPKDLELRFAGTLVGRLEEDSYLRRDLALASTVGFFAVIFLLVFYTRRIRTLILLGAPLFVGLSWTFAFADVAVGRLNILSGFLATILSGLGIEYGIHLLLRYTEERKRGAEITDGLLTSIATTGRALVGSALTNSGAFFVVSFAGFEGFREFGRIAGVGMLLTLVASLVGLPAVLTLFERIRPMKIAPMSTREVRGIQVPRMARHLILALTVAFFGYSVWALAAGKARFHTNWRDLKGDSPAAAFDEYLFQSFGGTVSTSLVFVDDARQLDDAISLLEKHIAERKTRGLPTGLSGIASARALVPAEQEARLERIAGLREELDRIKPSRLTPKELANLERAKRLTEVRPFTIREVPASLKQSFETRDGAGSLIVLKTHYRFFESSEIIDFANEMDELRTTLDDAGIESSIIAENWLAGTVFKIILKDGPFILGATFLVIFCILLVEFRSAVKALVIIGALVVGQVSMAGAMAIFGIELNYINAAVLPIVVGVSIDNAMHIYHRFLAEGPGAIPMILRQTASATALSSATNLMGFGAMLVAHHRGLRSVAELAIVGIGLTFFSTSIFFPLMLDTWSKSRLGRPRRQA